MTEEAEEEEIEDTAVAAVETEDTMEETGTADISS